MALKKKQTQIHSDHIERLNAEITHLKGVISENKEAEKQSVMS